MKTVLQFNAGAACRDIFSAIDGVEISFVDPHDTAALERELADTEVLLHVLAPITKHLIDRAPKLKLIQKIGVGTDTIDLMAAKASGVAVANMPGINTAAVAEHTLALMLATLRRIILFDIATKTGQGWDLSADILESSGELAGRVVGFVGFGAVPQKLTPILNALGCNIRFYNRSPMRHSIAEPVSFDDLLQQSDIISLHIPSTPQTKHIINDAALKKMKKGSIFINTGRGDLVDEQALVLAIQANHLAGAGLDVFENEPLREQRPLALCPTVTMTPHIAWLTPESLTRSSLIVAENVRRLKQRLPLVNRVV